MFPVWYSFHFPLSQDLKLNSLHFNVVSPPAGHKIQPNKIDTNDQHTQEIVNSHSNAFKFKDCKVKLNIEKEVVPITQSKRRETNDQNGLVP